MKKIIILSFVICVVLGANLAYYVFKSEPSFKVQMFDENVQKRIVGSVNNSTTTQKYIVYKTFQITHVDGTAVKVEIAKFQCCDQTAGLVTMDGSKMVLGFFNETSYKSPLSTTTEMLPEIRMDILIHELTHLATLHNFSGDCVDTKKNVCQEINAYDTENLYMQMLSYDEDNVIRIVK